MDWIDEKCTATKSEDFGSDLASVQRLQRKHEGLERDLLALNEKVCQLENTANELKDNHPAQADAIETHQNSINEQWNQLTEMADKRKDKLLDSYDLQRFFSDYRLAKWCVI